MKNLLMLAAVLALCALFLVFWDSPPDMFGSREARIEALPSADSYMRNTLTSRFNHDGVEIYTLAARTGLYYSADDRFTVDEPQLLARDQQQQSPPWHVTATTAHTVDGSEELVLSGEVHAWQDTEAGKNTFTTTILHFYPDQNRAETTAQVAMDYPGGHTTGVGMHADFNTRTYQILNQVQGKHYAR